MAGPKPKRQRPQTGSGAENPSKGHNTSQATSAIPSVNQAVPSSSYTPPVDSLNCQAFGQSHTSATKPNTSLDNMSGNTHWGSQTVTLEPANPQPPTSSQRVPASMEFNESLDTMLYSLCATGQNSYTTMPEPTNPQPPTSSQGVLASMELNESLDAMLYSLCATGQNSYTTTPEPTNPQPPTSSQSVAMSTGHNGSLSDMPYTLYNNFPIECQKVY